MVVCTTFIKNLAHVLCSLYLEIMFITLNGKSDGKRDLLQSLQQNNGTIRAVFLYYYLILNAPKYA